MVDDRDLISILVPAYDRPDQVFQAILSCFDQCYRPLEIVVCDDTLHNGVGDVVVAIETPPEITLRYHLNRPARGQSGNVNTLLELARGSRVMILHDDDLLLPGGLDRLEAEWRAFGDPVCVFGKQVVVTETGALAIGETLALNRRYHRAGRNTAVQQPSEAVGLLQQIPNNGFLVDAAVARAIGYRPEQEVGLAADSDFGIRLTIAAGDRAFVLVDAYVSAYRINRRSMMRWTHRNQEHQLMFAHVERLALPPGTEEARRIYLDRLGPAAVLDAANAGDLALARRILKSSHYDRSWWSPHHLVALLSIAFPPIGAAIRPLLKLMIQTMRSWSNHLTFNPALKLGRGRAGESAVIRAAVGDHATRLSTRRDAFAALARDKRQS